MFRCYRFSIPELGAADIVREKKKNKNDHNGNGGEFGASSNSVGSGGTR